VPRDKAADVPKITRGAKRNRQGIGIRLAPAICFASLAVCPLYGVPRDLDGSGACAAALGKTTEYERF